MAFRQIPHVGLLSADWRDVVNGDDSARDRRGDDGLTDLRAAGTRHRSRQLRVNGAQEGGRILLMSYLEEPGVTVLKALRLEQGGDKPTLRFVTCGSVDDGKSTL